MIRNSEVGAPESGQLTDQTLQPGNDAGNQAGNQEPRTASEKYLASLWSEIIGLDRVSLPDKFLELGGNSLTLNIILNRIEAEKGVSLPAQSFFDPERSSLFELAREFDALKDDPDRPQEKTPVISCSA
jgi:ribosome assembly protein YihI (activator of Der GTPase)